MAKGDGREIPKTRANVQPDIYNSPKPHPNHYPKPYFNLGML